MKNSLFIVLIIVSISYSQIGSIYSNTPIGELVTDFSVRRNGLGLGIASQEIYDLNPINPASWNSIPYVKFIGSFKFSSNSFSDVNSNNKLSNGSFNSLLIALPVERSLGIVFSGGIIPYSKINYKVLSPENTFDSIKYTSRFEANGGITNYYFGLSSRVKNHFSIGLAASFLVGTVSKVLSTDFLEDNMIDPEFTEKLKYNGVGVRIGIVSENLNKKFNLKPFTDIRVGFSYLNSVSLNTNLLDLKRGFFIDTVSEFNFTTKIPSQIAFGLAFNYKNKYNLYIDYLNQNLSNLNSDYKKSSFELSAHNIYSIGVELIPSSKPKNFFETISWRAGLFYKDLGIKINGQNINETGIKAGLSFPIDQLNLLDIAVQYSIRGKKEKFFVKESIFNLWVGINFAEIWFVRSED